MGEFLELLSGYAIAENMTPFHIEEIGTSILPEWATIQSLNTGAELSSNQFFDANGITTENLTIIKNGKLREIFLSKAAADRLHMKPNGQSSPINVLLEGNPPIQTLAGISFLFTELAGMHTMDSATGNFSLDGEGYQIGADGTLGGFVKNVGLSGNIKTLFASMIGALDDTPNFGSVRMPTLIFESGILNPPVS